MSSLASDADPLRATADATWKALERIVDPCSKAVGAPVGLVSMGLVLDVSVRGAPGAATVNVELGVTEPGCMMQGIFSAAAEREIRALPGVADVVVRIDHGHVWDPDAHVRRISRGACEGESGAEGPRRAEAHPCRSAKIASGSNALTMNCPPSTISEIFRSTARLESRYASSGLRSYRPPR